MIQKKDIGALILPIRAAANAAATAGGSGDSTEVTGAIIDRLSIASPSSGVLAIPFSAALAEGETLTVGWEIEHGDEDDLSDAASFASGSAVVATGPTGGGTVTGCFNVDVKLRGCARYVRANYTPDLSASGTDTAALSALMICGGMDRLPQ
ncbi:hypothetical protein [Chachezhania sediminis]|uniref:hypothetical protein n=1 Tax=Chachezhania sediminis TaxID=2599291 RepID=UPI00131B669A|nr:hypothetical protein [Chachezhania sediminis]